ncbi:hypothetical protein J437_LFUL005451 [Ladona fulva]|uniref:Uncharacterized protein n=1 Tax=Ladona fulva TaxID=123851 RepID=A0A8K0K2N8_LADFU|nr:hypothetical protein J437_LFUL005451 [Ladona fulva]
MPGEGFKSCSDSSSTSSSSSSSSSSSAFGGGTGSQYGKCQSSSSSAFGSGSSSKSAPHQRRVQVTAKVLFGSVSAISCMKAAERGRKRPQ